MDGDSVVDINESDDEDGVLLDRKDQPFGDREDAVPYDDVNPHEKALLEGIWFTTSTMVSDMSYGWWSGQLRL